MKKPSLLVYSILLILLLNGIAIWLIARMKQGHTTPVYVAVACPLSGEGKTSGDAIRKGIRLCLERAKREGKLRDKRIELLFFNDQNDSPTALKIASQIAQDNRIVFVAGHYYNSSSEVAGAIYKKSGIPAITASAAADALTVDNEWYFRVVPNNHSMVGFIANYIRRALNQKTVSIIYDRNEYGLSLFRQFEATAKDLGIKIKYQWSFDGEDKQVKREFKKIVSELRSINDAGLLFFATQAPEAVQILSSLKYQGTDYTVIGPDSFSNEIFIESFNNYPTERMTPGYFTNGIFAVSPYIFDIGGKGAVDFVKEYEKAYSEKPSWVSVCYYDAMWTAIHTLDKMDIGDGMDIRDIRRNFRDTLASLNSYENSVDGITGKLFFNGNGDIKRPLSMGVYQNQSLIPAPVQYMPIAEYIESGKRAIKTSIGQKLFSIDDQFVTEVKVVYAGVKLNEINHLDFKQQTYSMDFYIWFRYEGEFDEKGIDFPDAIHPVRLGLPVFKETAGNLVTNMYRVRGDFKGRFNFRKYPFDVHNLPIRFRHAKMTRTKLILSPDTVSLSATNAGRVSNHGEKRISAIRGWDVEGISFHQDTLNIEYMNKIKIPYSQFNAEVRIKRSDLSSPVKILLPIIALFGMLYLIYHIPCKFVLTRTLLCLAIALIALAYQNILISQFAVRHMNIQYVFYAVYLLACCAAAISLIAYGMNRFSVDRQKIERLQLVGKIMHPVLFVAMLSISFFL